MRVRFILIMALLLSLNFSKLHLSLFTMGVRKLPAETGYMPPHSHPGGASVSSQNHSSSKLYSEQAPWTSHWGLRAHNAGWVTSLSYCRQLLVGLSLRSALLFLHLGEGILLCKPKGFHLQQGGEGLEQIRGGLVDAH